MILGNSIGIHLYHFTCRRCAAWLQPICNRLAVNVRNSKQCFYMNKECEWNNTNCYRDFPFEQRFVDLSFVVLFAKKKSGRVVFAVRESYSPFRVEEWWFVISFGLSTGFVIIARWLHIVKTLYRTKKYI